MRLDCLIYEDKLPVFVRYVVFGLWNTIFAWVAFYVIWRAGSGSLPLWLLAGLAHLVATTQSFFIQRRWVFKPKIGKVGVQYVRFQLGYLGLLGAGLLMLQALHAQGLHPPSAQVLVMAAQAVSGFVLGKAFTFSHEVMSVRYLSRNLAASVRNTSPVWLLCIASLCLFYRYLAHPFYGSLSHLGHDFALAATALLEGRFWLQSNGVMVGLFNPPWFTPAWCAGAAFFADPQAGFYSPFQWLAFFGDPFQATEFSALLFAIAAFWGGYLLARRVLGWQPALAAVFAVLGMANAFLPMRSAVGELGYQPLYVWVWLALALCWPAKADAGWRGWLGSPAIGAALALTAWLHFGFAGMMVPAFMGVVLLSLMLVIAGRVQLLHLVARAALGGVLAIVLNASKLYEAASLMRNFPRDFYGMPGFASLGDALVASVMALLLPSEWTADFGMRRLSDVQFTVLPHEWALEFGLGALAVSLMAAGVLLWLRQHKASRLAAAAPSINVPGVSSGGRFQSLAWVGILVIGILPPLLLWNQGAVRDLLKQIPILNSAAWPMRWIVIYLPVAQWLLAWPVQQVLACLPERRQWPWAAAAMVGIWLGPALAPVGYYLDPAIQSYDPKPVLAAFAQSKKTGPIPIDRIELSAGRGLSRNDTMLQGASQGYCYNPIYGYRLESFPQIDRLQAGRALATDASGQSLILNPSCLVHPEANACKPGDGFRMDDPRQRQAAENFLARRPFEWQRPLLGRVLSWMSQAAFWVLLSLLVATLWLAVLRSMRQVKPEEKAC